METVDWYQAAHRQIELLAGTTEGEGESIRKKHYYVHFTIAVIGIIKRRTKRVDLEKVMPLFMLPDCGHGRQTIDTVARYYGKGNTFDTCVGVADTNTIIM